MDIITLKKSVQAVYNFLEEQNKHLKSINTMYEYDLVVFEQMWGNTSMHREGIGGCAMTGGITIVLEGSRRCKYDLVFFNGELGYKVMKDDSEGYRKFKIDVFNKVVAGIKSKGRYS